MKNALMMAGAIALVWLMPDAALAQRQGGASGRGAETRQFRQEQRQERQEFNRQQQRERRELRQSMESESPHERHRQREELHTAQQQERRQFQQQKREENRAFLSERLQNNPHLSAGQTQELIDYFVDHQEAGAALRERKYRDRMAFFEQLVNDGSLSLEQKKEAIHNRFGAE